MIFKGPLEKSVKERLSSADLALSSPGRLRALERTALMDSDRELAFDRLAHLAAKILDVPLTIISLVGEKKQFFKAAYGLPAPYDETREVSIDDSICRYTLQNQAIIADDTSMDGLLRFHPTTEPWGIGAFIAIPMTTEDGHVLGAFCAVHTHARPWTDMDIFVMRELTASVMTEIKLRVQIQELKAESALREMFVTALSHDLRNPLSIAKMGAEALSETDTTEDERTNFSRIICDNVDRADTMIRDLLTASRIKAGEHIALNRKFVDIVEVARTTVDSLRRVHKREFLFNGPHPTEGYWDSDRVRRIIENLSGNAVKYGAPLEPVTISVINHLHHIEISVHNEGAPIPSTEIKTLFNLFERSKSAVDGPQKGWGIGLTVVRALTEEMGGRVAIVSSYEEGTCFTIHIPK